MEYWVNLFFFIFLLDLDINRGISKSVRQRWLQHTVRAHRDTIKVWLQLTWMAD